MKACVRSKHEKTWEPPSMWKVSCMERGENGAVSTIQALLRWRRSAHTLHSFPAPSTCFFGTISNFAFQRLPLLSAGTMVPFSSHFLICFSTILATSGENLLGGMKTGVAPLVQISVSPKLVLPGSPFQDTHFWYLRIMSCSPFSKDSNSGSSFTCA